VTSEKKGQERDVHAAKSCDLRGIPPVMEIPAGKMDTLVDMPLS
jgi:hypothetical protein